MTRFHRVLPHPCAGLLLLAGALLLTGCVTVNKTVLNDRSASPVAAEDVYVYLEDDEVPGACERVALLDARGDENWTNPSEMIDKFREETGKLGGNAVQIRGIRDPGTGERILAAVFEANADRRGEAVALWCPEGEGG